MFFLIAWKKYLKKRDHLNNKTGKSRAPVNHKSPHSEKTRREAAVDRISVLLESWMKWTVRLPSSKKHLGFGNTPVWLPLKEVSTWKWIFRIVRASRPAATLFSLSWSLRSENMWYRGTNNNNSTMRNRDLSQNQQMGIPAHVSGGGQIPIY